jgi:hypothetical protein
MGLEALDGALLVALHEARVADHVGGEDGGEPAVDAGSGYGVVLWDEPDAAMLVREGTIVRPCFRAATVPSRARQTFVLPR